ncbi:blast:Sushi%2C von Willebrand factor type A%2C EGF and pentraxin domain-containing protein 1 [Drosophila guanche]|uniref:Blast:Sushi, von Willebrand factor type A, EGF and pentraxin domain-containing protein 1 n=1 Tax=Drosophila guanche TaxID=7266 RepID=A0A3B0JY53_DROGU|nr:blast:Sushi%2C von Willebrand factor type A%2C EGF and pentraxin domain-containing protein 1 [Drosophila guanche]
MQRTQWQLLLPLALAVVVAAAASTLAQAQNIDADCSFPGSPAHSSVVFSNANLTQGTVASYSCERGFELLGPARRVCDKGQWVPEGIPFCVLNVAAGKAPMQISTEGAGAPQKAIDGSTSAFFTPETCSLTKSERSPWWYVNLLEPYMVQLVRLDFGKSCCGNKPATIVVRVGNNRPDLGTNPICNRFTGLLEAGQPLFLPCNPPMPGAFVSVHLENSTPNPLSICEAFVYTDQALPIERCPTFRDQPPGALASYNGKCYIFYNRQPLNFLDALSFCRSRGGTLISESNPALQGFISWELWRRHRSDVSSQYWMGAVRDGSDRSSWKWVNGDELTVSFWSHPGGDEDCARFDGSKGWLWSDTNCNTLLNFICQHQPKTCGRPEQPPNSTMVALNGFEVGAQIKYSCDSNHLLVGPATRTCLDTGFYNEFPPVCKYIECGLPASIAHGSYGLLNNTVGYLSLVKYACEEGYEMIGRALLTCDFDERWNGPPPRCEIVECDTLPGNYYNTIIHAPNGTYFGSKAEISCPQGYRMEGPRQLSCLASGQWSSALPRCIKLEPATQPTAAPTAPPSSVATPPPFRPKISSTTSRTPYRPVSTASTNGVSTSSTSTVGTYPSISPTQVEINGESDSEEDVNVPVPGTVREEFPPRRTVRPVLIPKKPISTPAAPTTTQHALPPQALPPSTYAPAPPRSRPSAASVPAQVETTTRNTQQIIQNSHPQDNEIPDSVNIQQNQSPNVNVPFAVDNPDRKEPKEAKLNLGAIVALGAFGGFVFLAAVITTIVILVRRNRTTQHYRHRASPDCNTVASFDSSTSGSRNGLNRYYRQAWENLHESASKNSSHNALRRKETLDPPSMTRSRDNLRDNMQRSRENLDRCGRDNYGMRDDSEMVVSDVCLKGEKKRHHHHHHKSSSRNGDYRDRDQSSGRRDHHRHSGAGGGGGGGGGGGAGAGGGGGGGGHY